MFLVIAVTVIPFQNSKSIQGQTCSSGIWLVIKKGLILNDSEVSRIQ